MKHRICLLALVVGLMAGAAAGQERHPAKAELLANVASIKPGEAFAVGVRFKLEPKWHVYWKHAGQAGIPTEIDFELPEGFEVGELQYPVPVRFVQPGDILGYGYENEVMLVATVTPPADLSADSVPIKATANWLVCDDICIPGEAKLSMTLPVAEEARPANRKLFATWVNRVPAETPGDGNLISNVKTEVRPDGRGAANVTTLALTAPIDGIDFYPAGDPGLRVENIKVQPVDEKQVKINYTITPLAGRKQWPAELEGLVVYTAPDGERIGTMITFPTPAQPADSED